VDDKTKTLRKKLKQLFPFLNEKQRRVLAASEAKTFGKGGVSAVAIATGMSRQTIYNGIADIDSKNYKDDRIRKVGGGRKKITENQPQLLKALDGLIEPTTRGHPESPLKWTCKSARNIAEKLTKTGHDVGRQSVVNLLNMQGYSLQSNRKTSEGKKDNPDRDAQFHYINNLVKKFLKQKNPVISVDGKKKELIGNYKNNGREWSKKGEPVKVLSHDFPDPKMPKAVPYGVYNIGENNGWVNIGIDADTAEFAVESIRQWWRKMGIKKYPKTKDLLICADAGGSNSYKSHLWKREIQNFANQYKIAVTVCHFPPGTSKWNKIEHRLFSYISINWRGKPLVDYQTVINLIAATKTKAGLIVKVRLDKNKYERGLKVPLDEIKKFKIKRHEFHGEWNYTIRPQ